MRLYRVGENVMMVVAAVLLFCGGSEALSKCSDKGGVCQPPSALCGGGGGGKFWASECGISLICCVTDAPPTTTGQLTNTEAAAQLSPYVNTSVLCSSRNTSGCVSLEGVSAHLVMYMKNVFEEVFPSVPPLLIASGSELTSTAGGLCSSGTTVTLTPSTEDSATALVRSILENGYPVDGYHCFNSFVYTSSRFYICISANGDLVFSFCSSAAMATPCLALSSIMWSRLISQRRVSYSSLTALIAAETAAHGEQVQVPDGGGMACLSPLLGYTLTAGLIGLYGSLVIDVVIDPDALWVSPTSRLNTGRAVRMTTPSSFAGLPTESFVSFVTLNESDASSAYQYEVSVPSAAQLHLMAQEDAVYSPSSETCRNVRQTADTGYDYNTTVVTCLDRIPMELIDTSSPSRDVCSQYVGDAQLWEYVLSCYRLDAPMWNCLISPSFEAMCSSLSSPQIVDVTRTCSSVVPSTLSAICSGFYKNGWYFHVQSNEPTSTMLSILSGSTSPITSVTYKVSDDTTTLASSQRLASNAMVTGYARTATRAGVARDDVMSSTLVYRSTGARIQVGNVTSSVDGGGSSLHPWMEVGTHRAVVSSSVLFAFCGVTTLVVASVGLMWYFTARNAPLGSTVRDFYATYRSGLCVVILFFTVVSAASMNWAQSIASSSSGAYMTMSNAGMCRCMSSRHSCPLASSDAFIAVNGTVSVMYVVLVFASAGASMLAMRIRRRGGFAGDTFYASEDYGVTPPPSPSSLPPSAACHVPASAAIIQLLETLLIRHSWIVSGLTLLSFVFGVVTLIIFATMQRSCLNELHTTTIHTLFISLRPSWGFALRIVETAFLFVLAVAIGSTIANFETPRKIFTWSRRQFVVTLILPLALASASSSSWMIQPFSLQHFSPFTVCTCRGWTCETTLGAHRASFALYTVFYSFYAAFFWLRIVSESRLYNAFFSFAKDWSISNKLRLGKRWRVDIGRVFLGIGVVTLAVSLLIFLSVVLAAKCGLGGTSLSYGFIFAALAYVGVLVVSVLELLTTDVFGDGFEDNEEARVQGKSDPLTTTTAVNVSLHECGGSSVELSGKEERHIQHQDE